jgi:hypothetical protein
MAADCTGLVASEVRRAELPNLKEEAMVCYINRGEIHKRLH